MAKSFSNGRLVRKKPVEVIAYRWQGPDADGGAELLEFFAAWGFAPAGEWGSDKRLVVPTLEGEMIADIGDYIVRGIAGEFYPVKPEIFQATYESVDAFTRAKA